MLALDGRFHHLVALSTRNDLLAAEIEMLYNLSLRIWYFYLDRLDTSDIGFDALAEVTEALEAREAARAEQAICRHIAHFGDSIRRCL